MTQKMVINRRHMNNNDDDTKTEIGIRTLCGILGFSPEDLKT